MKTKLLLSAIAILFVAVLYLLYLNLQKPKEITVSKESQPTPEIIPEISPSTAPTIKPKATSVPTTSPSKFGLTKLLDLPAVGVKAIFPSNVSISLQPGSYYTIQIAGSLNTALTFALVEYDGGGRRAAFVKKYAYAKNYKFEESNKGYIAYATLSSDLPGNYFYFTVVSPTKMLVVENIITNGFNFDKFKAFASTISTYIAQSISPEAIDPSQFFRSSENRITIWSNSDLGLKLIGPEWTENRTVKSRDANGNLTYTEWNRSYPRTRITENQIEFNGAYSYYDYITLLDPKYSSQSFDEVAKDMLLPSGFCAQEQPRAEVISNLILVKSTSIGQLSAQLRGINKSYSDAKDCRANDIWLIKAKNNRYVTSPFSPEDPLFKLEAY